MALRPLAALAAGLAAGAAAAFAPPTTVGLAAAFADGQRAYEAGRFAEAAAAWGPLAAGGDAEAQLGMGLLHDLGQGVPVDPGAAYAWYRRAAEAGLAAAQFNVAVMEDTGRVVPRNPAEAAAWYARAAAHGHARAQYNLGLLYAAGDGVPRNPDQAAAWYRAAARNGLPAAREKLAALGREAVPPAAARASPAEGGPGLLPVTPAVPAPEGTVSRPRGAAAAAAAVELAWVAPEQPARVRFFVEVRLLPRQGSAGGREVHAAYVDESATLVRLEGGAARYAWRVFAVGRGVPRYAASEWRRFAVGDTAPDTPAP